MTFDVKDSGQRATFETGSLRDTEDGKPRYDLIGLHGLRRLAEHMAKGAEKYGERNWEKGQPTSRSFSSALRHLMQWAMGYNDEDHLAAVAFNVFSIMHVEGGGNNADLWGKAGLMDHPRYPNNDIPNSPSMTEKFYRDVAVQVVADYQIKISAYGGTSEQLYQHCMETALAPFDKSTFLNTLVVLMQENVIQVVEDGYHDALWQISDMGTPEWWATDKNVVPQAVKAVQLGSYHLVDTVEVKEPRSEYVGNIYYDQNGQPHEHCETCYKCVTCKSCHCNNAEPYDYRL